MTWTRERNEAARRIVEAINSQRNRITGGYDIPSDEPGPVALMTSALAAAERRGLEEAATVVNGLIGKDCGNWNRSIIHAEDAIRQKAKDLPKERT